MVDPHFMLMHMQQLGPEYVVWDKKGSISFIRPGTGRVYAEFTLNREDIEKVHEQTEGGKVYEPTYDVMIYITKRTKSLLLSERHSIYTVNHQIDLLSTLPINLFQFPCMIC